MRLKIQPDYTRFVNINRYFSMDNINVFVLTGGRGIGKTTGLNIHCLQEYINKGNEFVYIRRYKTEIIKAKTMLDPLCDHISCKGTGSGTFEFQYGGVRIGYGISLTASLSVKSGMDFSKVTTIVFDEYILPPGGNIRYLKDEITMIFELISTIVRARTNYKIFFLGNNVDMFNPLFAYFNVPFFKYSYTDKERGLYCEMAKTKQELYVEEQKTPLYKLTQGTDYAKYHYENEVLKTAKGTIGEKDRNAKLMFRLIYEGTTLNIYRNKVDELYVEFRDKVISDDISLELMKNNRPNYYNITLFRNHAYKGILDICYYAKRVIYNNDKAIQLLDYIMDLI